MGIKENHDAQFMLLAGFIIAIGLVITTVTLNSIIFEGNMAIEAVTEPSKMEIVNLMAITQDEVKSTYRNTAATGGNAANATTNFSREINNFRNNLSQIYAQFGEGVNISCDVGNWNNRRYANFTNTGTASGTANWTVIEGVKNSTINVNITAITLPFIINITNSTKTWQINFTTQGNRIITNNDIKANITSQYTIKFINGANAAGNYSITGNTTYNTNFTRARDYTLNATILFSTSRVRVNITVPVPVPW